MADEQWIRYQFGRFILETGREQLRLDGELVPLQRKSFEVLQLLLANAGNLLRKEEIHQHVWPDRKVDDTNLSQHIYTLRRILGDNPKSPSFILTIPGKGYLFNHPVRVTPLHAESSSEGDASSVPAPLQEEWRDQGVPSPGVSISVALPARRDDEIRPLPSPSQSGENSRGLAKIWLGLLWISLLLAGFLGYHFFVRPLISSGRPQQAPRIQPLTSLQGLENRPRFSPDGNLIAFSNTQEGLGSEHLFVKQVQQGETIQITSGPSRDQHPTWSPDGQQLAFLRQTVGQKKLSLMIIPTLGGTERMIGEVMGGVDWSPDGQSLVVSDNPIPGTPATLWLLSVDGTKRTPLTSPVENDFTYDHLPRLSPDGRSIAFVRHINDIASDLYLLSLVDRSVRQLTFEKRQITSLAWVPDGKHLLFISDRSENPHAWRIAASGGTPTLEESVPSGILHLDISRSTSQLAFTYHITDSLIKVASLPPSPWESRKVAPLPPHCVINSSQGDHTARFSPDGSKVVYVSDQSGGEEIWKAKADGSKPVRITFFEELGVGSPRWSPDGKWIAFDRRSFRHADIYLMREDGSGLQQLTFDPLSDTMPTWSPDGEWVYFTSYRGGLSRIWKVSRAGGEPLQVTEGEANEALASADGNDLYFTGLDKRLYRLDLKTGQERMVAGLEQVEIGRYWDLTPNAIYYVSDRDRSTQRDDRPPVIYRFDLERRTIAPITTIGGILPEWLPGLTVTKDERMIAFSYLTTLLGDIQLVENWK